MWLQPPPVYVSAADTMGYGAPADQQPQAEGLGAEGRNTHEAHEGLLEPGTELPGLQLAIHPIAQHAFVQHSLGASR